MSRIDWSSEGKRCDIWKTLQIISEKYQNDQQRTSRQDFFRTTLSLRVEDRESNMENLIRSPGTSEVDERFPEFHITDLPQKPPAQQLGTNLDGISHADFTVSIHIPI